MISLRIGSPFHPVVDSRRDGCLIRLATKGCHDGCCGVLCDDLDIRDIGDGMVSVKSDDRPSRSERATSRTRARVIRLRPSRRLYHCTASIGAL